ncbi:hypothetical protein [Amycolatopsis methanolica]|uniref:hypothetical protein n=1 Tax=Amycolatopsis methanolica TaxID=1814 RepID=UPI00037C7D73|nr:hypothetical protein [Amycolatopsis methanolica]
MDEVDVRVRLRGPVQQAVRLCPALQVGARAVQRGGGGLRAGEAVRADEAVQVALGAAQGRAAAGCGP